MADENNIDIEGMPIINPKDDRNEELRKLYGDVFLKSASVEGQ
jgi:hypothetical protein